MKKLIEVIKSVFPDAVVEKCTLATLLEDIPDWDSMNSVNLQIELENAFGVSFLDDGLDGKTSIQTLMNLLKEKGAKLD